jgi:hypothetical protein
MPGMARTATRLSRVRGHPERLEQLTSMSMIIDRFIRMKARNYIYFVHGRMFMKKTYSIVWPLWTLLVAGCSSKATSPETVATTSAALSLAGQPTTQTSGPAAVVGQGTVSVTTGSTVAFAGQPPAGSPIPAASSPATAPVAATPLPGPSPAASATAVGGAASNTADATAPGASPSPDAAASSLEDWRSVMRNTPPPSNGCFTAVYPSTTFTEIACGAAPDTPLVSSHPATGIEPGNVGKGADWVAQAPAKTTITSAQGKFPTVSGVTSESSFAPNNYMLQLNSNTFPPGSTSQLTSLCAGGTTPNMCTGWQQFFYITSQSDSTLDYANQSVAFMQYWLLNYGPTATKKCPSGWSPSSSNCFINSASVTVPSGPTPVGFIADVALQGNASSGSDIVEFFPGNGTILSVSASSVLGLSQQWNQAEFNVFGDLNGSEACFNSGASLTGLLAMSYSPATNAVPTCFPPSNNQGFTAEFNNLNPSGSCTTSAGTGGNGSSIEFTENSAQTCLPGWGDYWPVAMQRNNETLLIATVNDGSFNEGLGMLFGTVPSLVALPAAESNHLLIAFQGANADLWIENTSFNGGIIFSATDQHFLMATGTSPSLAATSSGSPVVSFQGSNGHLWVEQGTAAADQNVAMAVGTSPAVAVLPNGQIVTAYQASNNTLSVEDNGAVFNIGLAMQAGTSPSIAVNGGSGVNGYAVAYTDNTGTLEVLTVGSPPTNGTLFWSLTDEGQAIEAGTSPSITYQPTSATPEFAFHGANGDLWVGQTGKSSDQGFPMAPGASPSILPLAGSGGYQVAFESSSSTLEIEVNVLGPTEVNTGFAMNTP